MAVIVPPTNKFPAMPAPPATTNAPVLVDVAEVVLLMVNVLVVPVELLTVKLPIVAVVMI